MRSKLFVPASRPELFAKALASEADALSFDLEDAVLPAKKADARQALAAFLNSPALAEADRRKKIIIRINPLDSEYFEGDLPLAAHPRVDIINLPKVESADDIGLFTARLELAMGDINTSGREPPRLLANIETPAALANAGAIASADPSVWGLQLGLGDMFEPLNIARYDAQNVHAIMFALRMAAAASRCIVYDSAYADVGNIEGYRQEALQARRLGFLGKTCIHPSQIAVANEVFQPTEKEIAWARKVLEAAEANDVNGAYLVDGVMIDAPFVARARDIIEQAQSPR